MKQSFLATLYLIMQFFNTTYGIDSGKTVYIFPFESYYGDKLFDMDDPIFNQNDRSRVFLNLRNYLREKGYDLKTTDFENELTDFAGLLVCHRPNPEKLEKLKNYSHEKLILIILEPPTVCPHYYESEYHNYFGKIFIMLDNYVDNKKYFKLFFPQTSLQMDDRIIDFNQKKLCTLISSNKWSCHPSELYTERRKIIKFFENYAPADFDLFGTFWDKKKFSLYRGSILYKHDVLKQYKFCICYENMCNVNGYITEKIFDAFIAGVVPVYWGAENITDFISGECFIDRRKFKSDIELYEFLKSINAEEYQKYINCIRDFLASKKAYYFSQEYFIENMAKLFF